MPITLTKDVKNAMILYANLMNKALKKQGVKVSPDVINKKITQAVANLDQSDKITASDMPEVAYNAAGDLIAMAWVQYMKGEHKEAFMTAASAFMAEDADQLFNAIVLCNNSAETADITTDVDPLTPEPNGSTMEEDNYDPNDDDLSLDAESPTTTTHDNSDDMAIAEALMELADLPDDSDDEEVTDPTTMDQSMSDPVDDADMDSDDETDPDLFNNDNSATEGNSPLPADMPVTAGLQHRVHNLIQKFMHKGDKYREVISAANMLTQTGTQRNYKKAEKFLLQAHKIVKNSGNSKPGRR